MHRHLYGVLPDRAVLHPLPAAGLWGAGRGLPVGLLLPVLRPRRQARPVPAAGPGPPPGGPGLLPTPAPAGGLPAPDHPAGHGKRLDRGLHRGLPAHRHHPPAGDLRPALYHPGGLSGAAVRGLPLGAGGQKPADPSHPAGFSGGDGLSRLRPAGRLDAGALLPVRLLWPPQRRGELPGLCGILHLPARPIRRRGPGLRPLRDGHPGTAGAVRPPQPGPGLPGPQKGPGPQPVAAGGGVPGHHPGGHGLYPAHPDPRVRHPAPGGAPGQPGAPLPLQPAAVRRVPLGAVPAGDRALPALSLLRRVGGPVRPLGRGGAGPAALQLPVPGPGHRAAHSGGAAVAGVFRLPAPAHQGEGTAHRPCHGGGFRGLCGPAPAALGRGHHPGGGRGWRLLLRGGHPGRLRRGAELRRLQRLLRPLPAPGPQRIPGGDPVPSNPGR